VDRGRGADRVGSLEYEERLQNQAYEKGMEDAKAPDRVVEAVRADLLRRSVHGFRKYGAGLDTNPAQMIDQLRHAYEETLDLANYLKWSIMRLEDSSELSPNDARGTGLGVKQSPIRRCQGGRTGAQGECLACFAGQGETCLSPAAG
jgi:hypothetical protein